MRSAATPLLHASHVTSRRGTQEIGVAEVADLSLALLEGTFSLIRGEEPAKELLVQLLALVARPESGEIFWRGAPTSVLSDPELARVRNQHFGFIFTAPFLLPSFSAVENVAMPMFKVGRRDPDDARLQTQKLLDFVGLSGRGEATVDTLTIEDQHRVSLARALANSPQVLVVENVDRDLDAKSLVEFLRLLQAVQQEFDLTVIATGSASELTECADRVVELRDGTIVHDSHPAACEGGATV